MAVPNMVPTLYGDEVMGMIFTFDSIGWLILNIDVYRVLWLACACAHGIVTFILINIFVP